ncbi:hypothetical protein [Fibrobacter sp.]|uniref:hypothetical protein n=1 Tax=Fibrobacter sp. TaxID=35828 RepID=UPI0038904A82
MGRKKKGLGVQTIDEMANELARDAVKSMCKDGKLTSQGRNIGKLMDRIMPDEKVDEWGWNLSRKERSKIKRRAAEKKAAEEKKKAEARARAAYRRKQRKFEENGLLEGFVRINWSFMAARDELKRRGFSLELMNKLKADVVARISPWNKQHHADYVNYFIYQYYLSCSELHIQTLPADQQETARKEWARILRPFKSREPWL